jgi:hypothetical protein
MNRHDRKNSKEYADLKTGSLFWLDPMGGAEFPPVPGMPDPPRVTRWVAPEDLRRVL